MMCVCCDTSGYVAAAAKNNAVYLSTHAIIMWLHTRPRIYRCGAPARFGTGGTTKLPRRTGRLTNLSRSGLIQHCRHHTHTIEHAPGMLWWQRSVLGGPSMRRS